jgi:hypothetical protein
VSILDTVAATVAAAFANVFYPATLYSPHLRHSDGRGGRVPTYTAYTGKALVNDYSVFLRGTLGIPASERNVILLGGSFTVIPKVGDVVTVQGASWEVIEIKRDPAAATYECRSKPATAPTRTYSPTLRFNEARHSMYVGQVV